MRKILDWLARWSMARVDGWAFGVESHVLGSYIASFTLPKELR